MQAKMMMYMLPIVFTVMMLFLPAALGVYMLTNSVLGIIQQLVIERIAPRNGPTGGAITVKSMANQNWGGLWFVAGAGVAVACIIAVPFLWRSGERRSARRSGE